MPTPNHTICARATPPGTGAIAIVRLSGPDAIALLGKCFLPHSSRQSIASVKSHTLVFGHLMDPRTSTSIDDVLVGIMRGPHSYTGEDVVEINCHGSRPIVRGILRALTDLGARLAEPGEFTRRAFEHGQIDLTQAEAVCDLITAQTDAAARIALRQLEGGLTERLEPVRAQLLDLLAEIEAQLDFPEEDIPPAEADRWILTLHSVAHEIERLLADGERGRLLREGARIAIVGKPNAGKSSLFNCLLGQSRAIVTPHPGTTRDTIESTLEVGGIPLTFIDTAGIRTTTGEIERIGVERTEAEIEQANTVVMCAPADTPWGEEDELIWRLIVDRAPVVVMTKCDLQGCITAHELSERLGGQRVIRTSALTGDGIETLLRALGERVSSPGDDSEEESWDGDPLIASERHIEALRMALNTLGGALRGLTEPPALELAAADLRAAVEHLDQILGHDLGEEVLDRIFAHFCIGK